MGIERVCKILMPDISQFTVSTLISVMGQVFFSMTIRFSVLILYGSYLSKKENLVNSTITVSFFTIFIAFVADMFIIHGSYIFTSDNIQSTRLD